MGAGSSAPSENARSSTKLGIPYSLGALLVCALFLAGCATYSPPPSTRKSGGYYLDDGPGDRVPANLDQIPDAVPRIEPIRVSTTRPYTVMGRTYTPMSVVSEYKARGVASWYGRRYHGQATSSGERYDMYAMTAAHPILPIPSYVRVTNVANGKSVVVRVNDRGPFHSDRLIDLSYVAAYKLGIVTAGSDVVEVSSIVPGRIDRAPAEVPPPPSDPQTALPAPPLTAEAAGVFVQLGAFGQRDNADVFMSRMRGELIWLADAIALYTRDGLFRVYAGPYADRTQALQVAERVEQTLGFKPLLSPR